jgi:hypothetical protein
LVFGFAGRIVILDPSPQAIQLIPNYKRDVEYAVHY